MNIGDIYKFKQSNGSTGYWLCSDMIPSPQKNGEVVYLGFITKPSDVYPKSISNITIDKKKFFYSKDNCLSFNDLKDPEFKSNHYDRMDEFYRSVVQPCKFYDVYNNELNSVKLPRRGIVFTLSDNRTHNVILNVTDDYSICFEFKPGSYANKVAYNTEKLREMFNHDQITYKGMVKHLEFYSLWVKHETGVRFFLNKPIEDIIL